MKLKLKYDKNKPYFSTLTGKYYPDYDGAFGESLRAGGGAAVDFNLYYIRSSGDFEIVF